MFGLETFQLVLVLVGAGFIAAGLFGLVPVMSASRSATAHAGAAPAAIARPRQPEPPIKASKAQVAAPSKAEPEKPVAVKPTPAPEAPVALPRPSLTLASRFTPFSDIVQEEAAKLAEVSEKAQPEAVPQTLEAPVKPVQSVAPPPAAEKTAEPAAGAVDEEVVEELFAELFALRSSVGALTSEVREMRAEQKARRIILREVVAQPAAERKQAKTSA